MTNLEYVLIKGEIERQNDKVNLIMFKVGIIAILIGSMFLGSRVLYPWVGSNFKGFMMVMSFIAGIVFIIGSFTNIPSPIKDKIKKLEELKKEGKTAEDALEQLDMVPSERMEKFKESLQKDLSLV